MADTVLLTGISGFLGSHIALQLLKAGYKVRGSVRNLSRSDEVRQTMQDNGAKHRPFGICCARPPKRHRLGRSNGGRKIPSAYSLPLRNTMPDDEMELIRPAVEGTARAINAALKANVEHIVLTSSMASVMYGHDKSRTAPFSEQDWTDTDVEDNAYVRSKTFAEQKAWELMDAATAAMT